MIEFRLTTKIQRERGGDALMYRCYISMTCIPSDSRIQIIQI